MAKKRREHRAPFKFRGALEAAQAHQPISELASASQGHPTRGRAWKKHLLNGGLAVFERGSKAPAKAEGVPEAELYEQIGRLKMEWGWLKKKLSSSVEAKRQLIAPPPSTLSMRRQGALMGLNRSSYSWEPAGEREFKRRRRQSMGLQAVFPRRRRSHPTPGQPLYPYLRRALAITRPNPVWRAAITEVALHHGLMDLLAVIAHRAVCDRRVPPLGPGVAAFQYPRRLLLSGDPPSGSGAGAARNLHYGSRGSVHRPRLYPTVAHTATLRVEDGA